MNENGTLDNTFGTNGIAFQISNYGDDVANDVMLLEDGSILTTGYADVLNQQVIVTKPLRTEYLMPPSGRMVSLIMTSIQEVM